MKIKIKNNDIKVLIELLIKDNEIETKVTWDEDFKGCFLNANGAEIDFIGLEHGLGQPVSQFLLSGDTLTVNQKINIFSDV